MDFIKFLTVVPQIYKYQLNVYTSACHLNYQIASHSKCSYFYALNDPFSIRMLAVSGCMEVCHHIPRMGTLSTP